MTKSTKTSVKTPASAKLTPQKVAAKPVEKDPVKAALATPKTPKSFSN